MTLSFFHSFSSYPMALRALLGDGHSRREFLSWLRDTGGGFRVAAPSTETRSSKTCTCCKLEGFFLLEQYFTPFPSKCSKQRYS